jgi:hypothetical protein
LGDASKYGRRHVGQEDLVIMRKGKIIFGGRGVFSLHYVDNLAEEE